MKKITLSLAVLCLVISAAIANVVSPNLAQTVAANYYWQNTQRQVMNVSLSHTETAPTGEPLYFVFNMNNKEGFVIVSAEDAGHPIIGYSTEGNFDVSSATSNPEFNFWMEKRKSEITEMRAQNIQADLTVKNEWNNYLTNKIIQPTTMSTVNPQLVQSTWNQNGGGNPAYNALCPGGSVTGCVATAMAQIMRYWGCPVQGTSSSSYTAATYGTLSADYGSTTYNWANMPLNSSNYDVALISYHCGVSVQMNYSPTASGAMVHGGNPSAQYSYPNYFKYDAGINSKSQNSYSTATWIQLLEAEFAAGRPVQYEGQDPTQGGHTWVCDGNDASDNMHMNWGWGGSSDGYYAVTNLVPTGAGISFTQGLGGLFGIKPVTTSALDAGTFSISSPTGITCNPVITPVVTIKNFGSSTLTSCTITYQIDNGPPATYDWTGSLGSYISTSVTLPALTVSVGAHTFTSSTNSPNSGTDANTSNDQMQTSIIVMANTASVQSPYSEGFENAGYPYNDCYINFVSGTGPTWNQTSTASYSGSSSLTVNNFSSTVPYVEEAIFPAIDLSSAVNPQLTFRVAYAQKNSTDADQLRLLVSTNCGTSWVSRYSKYASSLKTDTSSASFTPSVASQWRLETISLASYVGNNDFRFKFEFTGKGGKGNNLYLDDININAVGAGVAEEYANGFNLNVSPNPFVNNATISFNLLQKNTVSVGVYDIIGNEVIPVSTKTELSAGTYSLPLSRNDLKPGIYFIKLNVDNYSVMKKIIVQ